MEKTATGQETYSLYPVGRVRRENGNTFLDLEKPFRPGLAQLEHFSYVIALWWVTGHDNSESRSIVQCKPPYAPEHLTGVFACRSEYRPNPIAITTCKILGVDHERGRVQIAAIDAFDDTPLLDLKGYFPVCDRVREAHIPAWLEGWPEWMPDEGLGLDS
jgi:tRNA-Thr(GGU) m(6)t(6)A37 methyltransferase TsaA